MSLYLDTKYVGLLSIHLPTLSKVANGVWLTRCPICGDSHKSKTKRRGYIYTKNQKLLYNCKNCDASMSLGNFIEQVSPALAKEYRTECYLENNPRTKNTTAPDPVFNKLTNPVPIFAKLPDRFKHKDPFDGELECLIALDHNHPAIQYVTKRQIPKSQLKKLYFIQHIRDITKLEGFEEYADRVKGKESRLVMPFFDLDGNLTGVTCRDLENTGLRYITLKLDDEKPLIFGINEIDRSAPIIVVEGPIDSLFVDNCIAVGGTGMQKLDSLGIEKKDLVIVFDNQPRNREVVEIIDKTIRKGYTVVIWPDGMKSKDINDCVLNGEDFVDVIQNCRYSGLMASLEFNRWKKI